MEIHSSSARTKSHQEGESEISFFSSFRLFVEVDAAENSSNIDRVPNHIPFTRFYMVCMEKLKAGKMIRHYILIFHRQGVLESEVYLIF